jgi:proton-dependent oligopeptide transporter, POT family
VTRPSLANPRGLFYLAFTEAWERFSFYGMTALVVLYMVNQLLLPGHVEHIAGFSGFRAGLESLVGPVSTQALASQIFGLYSGFVYFTPLLGGMIADRWIGQRNAVVIGALSMSGGHIAPKQYIDRAIPAARRAIQLDDSPAEAHAALANAIGAD